MRKSIAIFYFLALAFLILSPGVSQSGSTFWLRRRAQLEQSTVSGSCCLEAPCWKAHGELGYSCLPLKFEGLASSLNGTIVCKNGEYGTFTSGLSYTAQQLKDTKRAGELYHVLGAPSVPTFKSMLQMNIIKKCPVTSDHVDIAKKIFRNDVGTLKGKTTRKQTLKVLEDTVDVPGELYKLNSELELYINGMYVNKRLFITSINKTI